LTRCGWGWQGPGVSTEVGYEARRKHRHDLGHEDHGPVVAAKTTRGIQTLLGLWIALTFALVLWMIVDSARQHTSAEPPAVSAANEAAP